MYTGAWNYCIISLVTAMLWQTLVAKRYTESVGRQTSWHVTRITRLTWVHVNSGTSELLTTLLRRVQGFFSVGQGGRTPPPLKSISPPPLKFSTKRGFLIFWHVKSAFLGKIPADFRISPPGKIRFLPFPTWKKTWKKPCRCSAWTIVI